MHPVGMVYGGRWRAERLGEIRRKIEELLDDQRFDGPWCDWDAYHKLCAEESALLGLDDWRHAGF